MFLTIARIVGTGTMEGGNYARQAYDAQLRDLEHLLLEMATLAEAMVGDSVQSLVTLDRTLALDVMERDDGIDSRDLEIEAQCMRLLALQQPTGADLRLVGSVLKIITDIERVADLAVDLAKFTNKIESEAGKSDIVDLPRIATIVRQMFREAIQAYVRRDLTKTKLVAELEHEVDAHYREMRTQIFAQMIKDPEDVVSAGWLLLAIHHLERMADHALNIAERVEFMVTGEYSTQPKRQIPPSPADSDNAFPG